MDYELFKKQILEGLRREESRKDISLHKIEKNNGVILDAVTITDGEEQMVPTIYLKDFYESYLRGIPMEEIIYQILEINEEKGIRGGRIDTVVFEDYNKAKSHICYKVINQEMNKDLLRNVPYVSFLDLAVVFYYRIDEDVIRGGSFLVHNCNMESWGVTVQELYADAELNTSRNLPYSFQGMEEMLCQLLGGVPMEKEGRKEEEEMFILTNSSKYYGAAAMLYPHVLSHISKLLHGNYFVLPSSIHECILVPDTGKFTQDELERMVREVNETQVEAEEVLSHHVYYYDSAKDLLEM